MTGSPLGDLEQIVWRKSTASPESKGDNDCVEIAAAGGHIMVRDSKHPAGPFLSFHPAAWRCFMNTIRTSPDRASA